MNTLQKGKINKFFSSQLLFYKNNEYKLFENKICQSWLIAHSAENLSDEKIKKYIKILVLLQDICSLLDKIEIVVRSKSNEPK